MTDCRNVGSRILARLLCVVLFELGLYENVPQFIIATIFNALQSLVIDAKNLTLLHRDIILDVVL